MTVYVSQVAAVPGPVLPLLILAAFGCAWLAWRAWNEPPNEPPAVEERPRLRLVEAPYDWADDEDGAA